MNGLMFRYKAAILTAMLLSVLAGCEKYDNTEITDEPPVYKQRSVPYPLKIWSESFSVPGKGVWGDGAGNIISDFNDVTQWTLQYSDINLADDKDYAKTVTTSGGRFEVCDIDGEVRWMSEPIDISGFEKINIRLDARETGSNTNTGNKYLKALYIVDNNAETPFEINSESAGNWGSVVAEQKGITGTTLYVVVYIANNYASDKVILDEIIVAPEEKVYPAARPGELVINEVLFNPHTGGEDFVEIFNTSDKEFPMNKYFLASRDKNLELTQICSLAGNNYLLQPGGYLAITKDTSAVFPYYFIECRDCFQQVARMPSYNNDEDHIVLLNENMEIIDELHYTKAMHHPLLADKNGISLERLSPAASTNTPDNWASAATRAGYATPGYENSQSVNITMQKPQVTFSPEAFSPNADGRNNRFEIRFNLDKPGYTGTVNIFDSRGRRVINLANGNIIGHGDVYLWDGTNSSGHRQTIGIYYVTVELLHTDGRAFTFKHSVALTDGR